MMDSLGARHVDQINETSAPSAMSDLQEHSQYYICVPCTFAMFVTKRLPESLPPPPGSLFSEGGISVPDGDVQ